VRVAHPISLPLLLAVAFATAPFTHAAQKKGAPEVYSAEDPDASPADEDALLNGPDDAPNSDSGNAWAEIEPAQPPAPELEDVVAPPPPVSPAAQALALVPAPAVPATPEPQPTPQTATPKAAVTAKTPQGWGMFDPVPGASRRTVAERLKLVSILIQKYGRAYDYRVHTIRQLRHILKVLETQ
jgi:hypothetical protein